MANLPQPYISQEASAASEQIYDQFTGPSPDEYDNSYINQMLAQSFVAQANYRITRIELNVRDIGLDTPVTLTLASNDVDGKPGTPLATTTANGPDGWVWVSFTIGWPVIAGQVYWIELIDDLNQQSNSYSWAKRSIEPRYASGDSATCSGSNCKWQTNPNVDYLFKIYGIYGPSIDGWCEVNAAFAGTSDPLNYTIYFDNTGTQYAPDLWINMTLSPDLIYESDDSLLYGGTHSSPSWVFENVVVGPHSFHINVTVGQSVKDGTILRANFTFQYSDDQGHMQEDRSCSATTIARVPSLSMFKTVTPIYSIKGGDLNYSITFTNSGSRQSATVWINDTLPPSVNYSYDTTMNGTGPGNTTGIIVGKSINGNDIGWIFANVVPGTYRFNLTVTINLLVLNGTPISNCAMLNYTDSSGRVVGPVKACATARVEGASIRAEAETLDSPVARNDTLRYVVRLNNEGTAPAAIVWLNDTLPQGVTYVADTARSVLGYNQNLSWRDSQHLYYVFENIQTNDPILQPRSFVITVLVGTTVVDGEMLCNIIDLVHTDWDHTMLLPSTAGSCSQVKIPNIELSVTGPSMADPGDFVSYDVTLANTGSGTSKQVWFSLRESQQLTYYYDNSTDYNYIIPEVIVGRKGPQTWLFENVIPCRMVMTFTYKLRIGVSDGEAIVSSFEMNYTDYKGRSMGAVQLAVALNASAPIISLVVVGNMDQVPRGDEIVYTIFFNNTGSGYAQNVWINDTIPDDTVFWRSSEQYVASSGGKFTWHFVNVAPGDHNMTVTVRIDNQAEIGEHIINSVDMLYEDANGNFIDRLYAGLSSVVIDGEQPPDDQAGLLWLLILVLFGTLAVMWLYVARKFYGLGVKDKARIDELFLLHRSGELVRHHSRSLRPDVDSDVLSAMLVAVQNFVKESFNFRAGDLEELKFGDQKIMMIHGQHVILAAVIAGKFPQVIVPKMRSALDEIESRFGSAIDDWSGFTEDLPEVDDILSRVFEENGA